MNTTIRKWGSSQGIRIPKYLLESINWLTDEAIEIVTEDDKIIITKSSKQKNIIELFADFHGDYISETIDWGTPVGKEIW